MTRTLPPRRSIALGGILLTGACLAAAPASAAAAPKRVYANDFENSAGKEWSADKIEVTPKENRRFLGLFTTEKLTLKLEKLPKHQFVRVSCDLFIMMTWDGNATTTKGGSSRIGPDSWRMSIEDGPTLVDATFSNHDFANNTRAPKEALTQSYPSVLSGESYPAKTGAAERNTLGYEWNWNDGVNRPMDSVYRLSFIVPHDAAQVQFNFQGGGALQPGDDECWGLDNVSVDVLDAADLPKLDAAEMRRLWETVGGRDPSAETQAFWRLAAGGDAVARFLGERVKHGAGTDRTQFDKLVTQLDGDDFRTREAATEALKAMGPSIEALLRDAIEHTDSAEVKLRLEAALKNLAKAPPADPEDRRRAIALKLLRVIGTAEATRIAGELSGK